MRNEPSDIKALREELEGSQDWPELEPTTITRIPSDLPVPVRSALALLLSLPPSVRIFGLLSIISLATFALWRGIL